MDDALTIRQVGEFTIRERVPEGDGPHPVMLLVHGWTGDENVMWVFTPRLDARYWLIAPRGLYPAGRDGFSWQRHREGNWPEGEEFLPAVNTLQELLTPENFPGADLARIDAMGFSQGAALTYMMALAHPDRMRAFAGLSGFMPTNVDRWIVSRPLVGKPVFIAHGTEDERVPVERARQSVELLERAGARVTYCEEEVGHKLSAACFRGLESFFKEHFPKEK